MRVAVVGATGLVGREMLSILAARPEVVDVVALASDRSAGARLAWRDRQLEVEAAWPRALDDVDAALFSAGAEVARALAPRYVAAGVTVVDNSGAFRMDAAVPLVVPEVNPGALDGHRGLIANPNCSTIQLVVALQPLVETVGVERVHVATYQSVSGAGAEGVAQLAAERAGAGGGAGAFPRPIDRDLLPHCGDFDADGWTTQETKLLHESRKILGLPDLRLSATAVRVPVERSHSEAVWVETREPIEVAAAHRLWAARPAIRVEDRPADGRYPTPRQVAGTDHVHIGRVRRDPAVAHGLAFWVVADNVRKGAALNAVQILTMLGERRLLRGAAAGPLTFGG